jgi:hypothetical protein
MSNGTDHPPAFSAFWPICLLSVAFLIYLAWQLTVATQQLFAAVRMSEQQVVLATQAADAERKLQALMTDLILLANKDPDARAIKERYAIRYTPPSQVAAQTSAVPDTAER